MTKALRHMTKEEQKYRMRAITTEPTARQLDNIYVREQTRRIIVDGVSGTIEYGVGGWGNAAIVVTLGTVSIVACERESEDYEGLSDGETPETLQVYNWQRENLGWHYYHLLADALHDRNRTDRAY